MFKVLTKGCEPTRGSKYSACVDLYAAEDVVIGAGETKIIGLGVAIDHDYLHDNVDMWCGHPYPIKTPKEPNDFEKHKNEMHNKNFEWYMSHYYLQLMLHSSLGKKGLILPNGVGIIDLDHKDEIKMIIHNSINIQSDAVYFRGEHEAINADDNCSVLEVHKKRNDIVNKYRDLVDYEIKKGDKIAQITLIEHKSYLFGIDTDKESDGGFGSTGS